MISPLQIICKHQGGGGVGGMDSGHPLLTAMTVGQIQPFPPLKPTEFCSVQQHIVWVHIGLLILRIAKLDGQRRLLYLLSRVVELGGSNLATNSRKCCCYFFLLLPPLFYCAANSTFTTIHSPILQLSHPSPSGQNQLLTSFSLNKQVTKTARNATLNNITPLGQPIQFGSDQLLPFWGPMVK